MSPTSPSASKAAFFLTVASLFGVLVGGGITFGTALQEIRHVRDDLAEIKGELRETNTRLEVRVDDNRARIQRLEVDLAKLCR